MNKHAYEASVSRALDKAPDSDNPDAFNGFRDANDRLHAAKLLLLSAAIDIEKHRKDGFANAFKKAPNIHYEMAIDSRNRPMGRYYQTINGKDEIIHLKNGLSRLAKLCMDLRIRNNRFKGVRGELRPEMFRDNFSMFKDKPGAEVFIVSGDPKSLVKTK